MSAGRVQGGLYQWRWRKTVCKLGKYMRSSAGEPNNRPSVCFKACTIVAISANGTTVDLLDGHHIPFYGHVDSLQYSFCPLLELGLAMVKSGVAGLGLKVLAPDLHLFRPAKEYAADAPCSQLIGCGSHLSRGFSSTEVSVQGLLEKGAQKWVAVDGDQRIRAVRNCRKQSQTRMKEQRRACHSRNKVAAEECGDGQVREWSPQLSVKRCRS